MKPSRVLEDTDAITVVKTATIVSLIIFQLFYFYFSSIEQKALTDFLSRTNYITYGEYRTEQWSENMSETK